MKWKDRLGILTIMTLWWGLMGLLQTGNPFTEQPMFLLTKEGLIIGFILGIIIITRIDKDHSSRAKSRNNNTNNVENHHDK